MPALACLPSWLFCAGGLRQTGRWVSRLKINWHLRGIYSGGKRERIEAQLRVSRLERNCWNKQLLRLHSLIISVSIYMKWVNVEGGDACGSAWHRRSFFALCFASMSDNHSPQRLADCGRRQQRPLGIWPHASLRNDSLFVVIHAGFTKVDWPFGSDQTWSYLGWLGAGEGKLRLVGWSLFAWAPLSPSWRWCLLMLPCFPKATLGIFFGLAMVLLTPIISPPSYYITWQPAYVTVWVSFFLFLNLEAEKREKILACPQPLHLSSTCHCLPSSS